MDAENFADPTCYGDISDPIAFTNAINLMMRRVCTVETGDGKFGTGFLVGPDLVMTNYHVVKTLQDGADLSDAICRFDFARKNPGRKVAILDAEAIVSRNCAADDALGDTGYTDEDFDYAIIQLGEPIGETRDEAGVARGWMRLRRSEASPKPGLRIFVLQHPESAGEPGTPRPVKYSEGFVRAVLDGGRRIRHDAGTGPGSSGSPVFNVVDEFSLIALHNAGDDLKRQAVPIEQITDHIWRRNRTKAEKLALFESEEPAQDVKPAPVRPEVEIRRQVAQYLINRSDEDHRLLWRLPWNADSGSGASPIVHAVVSRASDCFEWYVARTRALSFAGRRDEQLPARIAALQSGFGKPAWNLVPLARWPDAAKPADKRLAMLVEGLAWIPANGNQLAVCTSRPDRQRDPAADRQLVVRLAAEAAKRFDPARVQIFFNFIVEDSDAEIAESLGALWDEDSAPPACGMCAKLSDVALSDLDEWKGYLEGAFGVLSPAFSRALDDVFQNGAGLPLKTVGSAIESALDRLIEAAL